MGIRYDIKGINQDVDIKSLLSHYGFSPNKKNKLRCPSINHTDKEPSASVHPSKNFCHCFACGATYNPIGLVMELEQCSLPKACNIIIKEYGLKLNDYAIVDEEISNETLTENDFPLSFRDLDLLRWRINAKKDSLEPTLKDYFRENKEEFYGTMRGKIEAEYDRYSAIQLFDRAIMNECLCEINAICPVSKALELSINYRDKVEKYGKEKVTPLLTEAQRNVLTSYFLYEQSLENFEKSEKKKSYLLEIADRMPEKELSKLQTENGQYVMYANTHLEQRCILELLTDQKVVEKDKFYNMFREKTQCQQVITMETETEMETEMGEEMPWLDDTELEIMER